MDVPVTDMLVYVDDSEIHGRGLFARTGIPEGAYIGRYEGRRTEEDGMHVLWVQDEDGEELYGIDGENELRYLNHDPHPNAEFDGDELYALVDIPPGSEITVDYGEDWAEEE